jgi:hypothetical protein
MITALPKITTIALEKEKENTAFQEFLELQDGAALDEKVQQLNEKISHAIDCTQCGNCCKSLLINVQEEEANILAQHLKQSRKTFDACYIEKGSNGMLLMNAIPCNFLYENKCSVYNYRFAGCREFPGLHLPNFGKRLFTVFMHYDRCPIVFNVIETLKKDFQFQY